MFSTTPKEGASAPANAPPGGGQGGPAGSVPVYTVPPAGPPPPYSAQPGFAVPPPQYIPAYMTQQPLSNGAMGPQVVNVHVIQTRPGPFPMQMMCSKCSANVMTATQARPGLLTFLLSGALIVLGCWFGCCLIPCCVPECQDIEHRCPNCNAHMGTFARI